MSVYKIIASDLDGTLLDESGKVSEINLAAIRSLGKRGIHFVPASGRSLSEIPAVLLDEDSIRYYIHSSGAAIYDKILDESISFGFSDEPLHRVLDLVLSSNCHVTLRKDGRMLCSGKGVESEEMSYYNVFPAHKALLRTFAEGLTNFKEKAYSDGAEMISLFFHTNEELSRVREGLLPIEGINIVSACDYNIEITPADAGKGNALSALAERLGVHISQTIAVGDSENDIQMLTVAGLGLAMDNAVEKAKHVADEIICNNNENVADFIAKKYF